MAAIDYINRDRLNSLGTKETITLYSQVQEEPSDPIYILLVDPLTFERVGLQMQINGEPDLKLIGVVGDFDSASDLIEAMQPDIIVIALSETSQEQINDVKKMAQAAPDSKIILLMGSADTELCVKVVKNGAMGVILKNQPPETLLKAIRKVNKGEAWLDHMTVAAVLESFSLSHPATSSDEDQILLSHLTQREREIVKFVGQGLNTRQIAKRLFLSESTIRHNLTAIYEKVGVSSRLELLIFAYRTGMAHCSK
jgi:DNA-binding NarL/FixJ family response regulator